MKLQYRYFEYMAFQYMIKLYCDGYLVKSYKVYLDEIDAEIDKLEEQGYTLGFTPEEVEKAEKKYKRMLQNIISREEDLHG